MLVSALYLLLHIAIIFGVAWAICYILQKFTDLPGQIQKFVWLVAAILAIIALALWAGV